MADETVSAETTETAETPVETTEQAASTEPEVVVEPEVNEDGTPKTEPEAKAEPAPEKFEPWKKPATKPETVPYDRFAEVNRDRRHFEEELAKAQAKLDELTKAQAPKAEELIDPEALDPKDFPGWKEYNTAVIKAATAKAVAQVRQEQIQTEQARRTHDVVQTIQTHYASTMEAACKEAPEIADDIRHADLYLSTVVDKIHPVVLRELMSDPNAALVMHAIASNKAAHDQLLGGDPVTSIKMIGQASAFIEARRRASAKQPSHVEAHNDEEAVSAKAELASTLPKVVRAQPASRKSVSDMSQSEYERWANKHFH